MSLQTTGVLSKVLGVLIAFGLSGCLGGEEPIWQSPSSVSVSENTQGSFYEIEAVDSSSGEKLTQFTLGGADASLFVFDELGTGLVFSMN